MGIAKKLSIVTFTAVTITAVFCTVIDSHLVGRHRLLAVGALGGGVDADGGKARRDVLAQLLQHDGSAVVHRLRV